MRELEDFVQTFTDRQSLTPDACARTFSVASDCRILQKHRRIIGFSVHLGWKTEEMAEIIVIYARQVLSE